MQLHLLLHAVGSLGVFPSRAFIPAFLVALFLRFGDQIPYMTDTGLLASVEDTPTWFTHSATIFILGILSLLECYATKDPDWREMMDSVDQFLKSGMSFLTLLGVMSVSDLKALDAIHQAGLTESSIALAASVGVFGLVYLRHSFWRLLTEIDADDSLGMQRGLSWLEDSWVILGTLLLIFLPVFMIIVAACILMALFAVQKLLQHWEEQQKVACTSCETMIYPAARKCFSCGHQVESPCRLGFLGQPKIKTLADAKTQPFALTEFRRCSECATHLSERTPFQQCNSCQHDMFADTEFAKKYMQFIDGRRYKVFAVCFVLGLIPIIGAIPAMIYYRLQLVSPYRRYLPATSGLAARWLVGLLSLFILLIQMIPFVGGLAMPIAAGIHHEVYRRLFQRMVLPEFTASPSSSKAINSAKSTTSETTTTQEFPNSVS